MMHVVLRGGRAFSTTSICPGIMSWSKYETKRSSLPFFVVCILCKSLKAADVWSGAVLIYALCTGRFAWQSARDSTPEYHAYKRGQVTPDEQYVAHKDGIRVVD